MKRFLVRRILFAILFSFLFLFLFFTCKTMLEDKKYKEIEFFLEQEDWENADKQTEFLIRLSALSWAFSSFTPQDLERVSCDKFVKIDSLWRKYSNNRFGFQIQSKIWDNIQESSFDEKDMEFEIHGERDVKFDILYKQLDWIKNDKQRTRFKTNYSLEAPLGHLPSGKWTGHLFDGTHRLEALMIVFDKLKECNLRE